MGIKLLGYYIWVKLLGVSLKLSPFSRIIVINSLLELRTSLSRVLGPDNDAMYDIDL